MQILTHICLILIVKIFTLLSRNNTINIILFSFIFAQWVGCWRKSWSHEEFCSLTLVCTVCEWISHGGVEHSRQSKTFTNQLSKWFQRGVSGLLGFQKTFWRFEMWFEGESLMLLLDILFQINQDLWKLASAVTQKNIFQLKYSS